MQQKIKILYPIGSFYPSQAGGPSNTIYWIARKISKKDFEIEVITTSKGISADIKKNVWTNTDFGRIIYYDEFSNTIPIKVIWRCFLRIKHVDIIHLNSIFFPLSWAAYFMARIYRKKIIWSPRGELYQSALNYSKKKKLIFLKFFKVLKSEELLFHSTSSEESESIKQIFSRGSIVFKVPNLIELPTFLDRTVENRFLFIGRLHPIKNLESLIRAFDRSQKFRCSPFTFSIAGDHNNTYAQYLKNLVKDLELHNKINFLGHVEGSVKQALFSSSYFFFLVSHSENFGNVVVEALSQGTPVVASRGTPWQILSQQNIGFWEEGTIENLKIVIEKILDMPKEDYWIMRNKSKEIAENSFSIEKNVFMWENVYNKIHKGCVG